MGETRNPERRQLHGWVETGSGLPTRKGETLQVARNIPYHTQTVSYQFVDARGNGL